MSDPVTRLNAALEGRYHIERQLGEGGMATVYLAKDLKHNRNVALKVLKPELAALVGAERFLAEIETTANLQHPHILPLFDSGEADGFLFYVMPYVEGESLREKLDREHQLPVSEAVGIATNVAEGLDYAHRHGVIHRDIKPANILLQDGKPVISDFGIALAVTASGAGRLTETGLSLGTPQYMSPEQATGDLSVGAATDVYALACVLYEMLVGEPPYTGSTAQAILGKIIAGRLASAREARSSVPRNVDAAIRKALEKLPADRFLGAQEFIKALADPAFRHGALVGAGAGAARRWNATSLGLATTTLALAALLAWSVFRSPPPQPVSRQVLSTDGWDGVSSDFGRRAAIAPDGSSMILPVGDQLGLKRRSSTDVTPVPGTEGARNVVYSPDGQSIAYAVGSEIIKRPLDGAPPLTVATDGEGGSLAGASQEGLGWLDDGTILYERSAGGSLFTVQISEGGGDGPEMLANFAVTWIRGLPGAQGALVVDRLNRLHVLDLRDGMDEVPLEDVVRAWYSPTGHLVYVRPDGTVLAAPFDLGTLEMAGGSISLFDGVRVEGTRADMALSDDGTLLYVEGRVGPSVLQELVEVDLDGNEDVLVLAPRYITGVGWSPDGRTVAYQGDLQVFTYDASLGTTPRELTTLYEVRPVFSPDGRRVAFRSGAQSSAEGWDLFVQDLTDDSPPDPLVILPLTQQPTQWPADSLLLFEAPQRDGASTDLWMIDPDEPDRGPTLYLESEAALRNVVLSPDGSLAAYASNESGRSEIYVRSFPDPGAATAISRSGGDVPFWSPGGSTLYYWRSDGGGEGTLFAARIRRDQRPALLSTDSLFTMASRAPFAGSALHPDGDRFIVARDVETSDAGVPTRSGRIVMVTNWFEELRERMGG